MRKINPDSTIENYSMNYNDHRDEKKGFGLIILIFRDFHEPRREATPRYRSSIPLGNRWHRLRRRPGPWSGSGTPLFLFLVLQGLFLYKTGQFCLWVQFLA